MAYRHGQIVTRVSEVALTSVLPQQLERAVDAGLWAHRMTFLPVHFTREALSRYAEEYRLACVGPRPRALKAQEMAKERHLMSEKLKAMNRVERAAFFAEERAAKRAKLPAWRMRQREKLAVFMRENRGLVSRGSRERSRDRNNDIPLYDTGAYKGSVLKGEAELQGNWQSRRLVLNAPQPYAHVVVPNWRGPGFNKTKAVEATTPEEWDSFAQTMEAEMQRQFDAM